MGRHAENEREFAAQSYLRLLAYTRPYWLRLTIGIAAGFLVGGSLFVSLMMIPRLVGVVDPSSTEAPGTAKAAAAREILRIADDPALSAAERQAAVSLVLNPVKTDQPSPQKLLQAAAASGLSAEDRLETVRQELLPPPGDDPKMRAILKQADDFGKKYRLPYTIEEREIHVTWPADFRFEAVSDNGRPAWQIFAIYMIVFVLAWIVKNVAHYINNYCVRQVGSQVVSDLREEVFEKLVNQSMRFYGNMDVGHLISRSTQDTAAIENAVSTSFADVTSAPIQIVACFAAILVACHEYQSYSLVVILLLGMPLTILPVHALGRRIRKVYKKSFARIAEVISRMHEVFTGIRVVKAYNTEAAEVERFKVINRSYLEQVIRALHLQLLVSPAMEVVAVAATLVFLLYSYSQGVSVTELAALLAPAFMAYRPLKDLSKWFPQMQRSMAAADRFFALIDTDTSLPEKPDAKELPSFERAITLEKAEFAYGERKILAGVDVTIPRGSLVAVVGETGSGKTTIANLIARFYDVTDGAVKIDGVDVRDYRISSLRKMIGVVNQDAVLFNDTIAHNISYGCPGATREEVIEASKLANAHSFIVDGRHPEGYDTEVGEKGFKLSGGEKQRVAIARAILRNPPILILDEATSALDTVTEKLVQEALNRVMANRTVFAIAHRLSTIRNASCILVLDQGRIAESGTHQELLERGGLYRKLHDTQFELDS